MQQNIHENAQVLQQIDWHLILIQLNDLVHFKKTLPSILTYLNTSDEINKKLNFTQDFLEYYYENEFKSFIENIYHLDNDFDFQEKIKQLKKQHSLSLSEINEFAKLAEIYIEHKNLIEKIFNSNIIESEFISFKKSLNKNFLTDFRKFVDKNGDIELAKHPIIRPLFEKQLQLENKIRSILNVTLRSDTFQTKIQYNSIDIINDRYVIPIKSDSYQGKIGQIIARSESGNTLFVEPSEIAVLNQARLEIIIEIQTILAKLELDITKSLVPYSNDFWKIIAFFYYCDEYITRVKFAIKLKLSRPTLSSTKEINLKNAFHPLIQNPVKNDLVIKNAEYGIIISGPNTGGKTATLKTLAITQIFLKYAFFIPCDYGTIFPYEKTFYFGNDQQNLDQGLSSFSAEVKNYASLFDALGNTNLILIDEIFNSTSSEEASALAIAFFQEVHKISNVHFIVSSHHQTLKTILHQDTNYLSAHVGFDSDTNKPTYKLHFGTPGSSHALKIFKNLTYGRDYFESIYKNSLRFLDHKVIHYEKLLESISEKEHSLDKVLQENSELNKQLKNQKQSMEGIIKLKIQEQVEKAEKKISSLKEKAEYIIKETRLGHINKQKILDNQFASIKKEIHSLAPLKQVPTNDTDYSNLSKPALLIEGEDYFCLSLKKTVTLKRIERNRKFCQVSAGNISMKVSTDSLMCANIKKSHTQNHSANLGISTYMTSRPLQLEYDCRGMRLEEFKSLIEDVTSDLLLGQLPYISIIHGHGTGVLKGWLRDYIKKSNDLQIITDQSGNDGETRISLI